MLESNKNLNFEDDVLQISVIFQDFRKTRTITTCLLHSLKHQAYTCADTHQTRSDYKWVCAIQQRGKCWFSFNLFVDNGLSKSIKVGVLHQSIQRQNCILKARSNLCYTLLMYTQIHGMHKHMQCTHTEHAAENVWNTQKLIVCSETQTWKSSMEGWYDKECVSSISSVINIGWWEALPFCSAVTCNTHTHTQF